VRKKWGGGAGDLKGSEKKVSWYNTTRASEGEVKVGKGENKDCDRKSQRYAKTLVSARGRDPEVLRGKLR